MSEMEQVSLAMPRRLKCRIQAMADDEHRPLSEMIRFLLWAAIFVRDQAQDEQDLKDTQSDALGVLF